MVTDRSKPAFFKTMQHFKRKSVLPPQDKIEKMTREMHTKYAVTATSGFNPRPKLSSKKKETGIVAIINNLCDKTEKALESDKRLLEGEFTDEDVKFMQLRV